MITTSPEMVCSADDRPAWLAARRAFVGASESYPIVAGKPLYRRSAADIHLVKAGLEEEPSLDGVERIELGNALEAFSAARFWRESGLPVERCAGLIADRDARMSCTPDYWVEDGGERAILEIKTAGMATDWQEGPPAHVWHQAQHQLAVTGAPHAYTAALCGGYQGMQFLWARIERDETYIRGIRDAIAEFWRRIDENDAPMTDGSPECRAALNRLYPEPEPEKCIPLPGEFIDLDEELVELTDRIKRDTHRSEEIKNKLRAEIGDATAGVIPNGVVYRNVKSGRGKRLIRKEKS